MVSRRRTGLIVAAAVVAALGLGWGAWQFGTRFGELAAQHRQSIERAARAADGMPVRQGRLFTNAQVYTFLATSRKTSRVPD